MGILSSYSDGDDAFCTRAFAFWEKMKTTELTHSHNCILPAFFKFIITLLPLSHDNDGNNIVIQLSLNYCNRILECAFLSWSDRLVGRLIDRYYRMIKTHHFIVLYIILPNAHAVVHYFKGLKITLFFLRIFNLYYYYYYSIIPHHNRLFLGFRFVLSPYSILFHPSLTLHYFFIERHLIPLDFFSPYN